MTVSTKNKIKKIALSLFAEKGYAGTSMREIADLVGIRKASLYSHYRGKEDLFFSVFDEVAQDYKKLNKRLIDETKQMKIEDRLYYIFRNYILHYYRNREIQGFWNQINFFVPSDLYAKYFERVTAVEDRVREEIEEILNNAMDQGLIRKDHPERVYMSFRAMCEGVIYWMFVAKKIDDEHIEGIWNNLWLGLQRR